MIGGILKELSSQPLTIFFRGERPDRGRDPGEGRLVGLPLVLELCHLAPMEGEMQINFESILQTFITVHKKIVEVLALKYPKDSMGPG